MWIKWGLYLNVAISPKKKNREILPIIQIITQSASNILWEFRIYIVENPETSAKKADFLLISRFIHKNTREHEYCCR